MSFASEVRKELISHYTKSSHCRKAELSAMLLFEGECKADGTRMLTLLDDSIIKKYTVILKKDFHVQTETCEQGVILLNNALSGKEGEEIPAGICLLIGAGRSPEKEEDAFGLLEKITQKSCCKRAFLRGAFIAAGTISDPEKHYHLEFVCESRKEAEFLQDMISAFEISARITKRRTKHVVYIKEGLEIVDMLNVMEAHVSLMNFENIRIVREMRGNVNRKVNCETANIEKTVTAAMKQIEDIEYIKETIGLTELEESLKQIALARLENPDIPLSKLGECLNPPIGKSGVNHRLRRISKMAEELRNSR